MSTAAPPSAPDGDGEDPLANATVFSDTNRAFRGSLSKEEMETRLAAARSGQTLPMQDQPSLGEVLGKVYQVFRKGEFTRVECLREAYLYGISVGTGLSFTYYFVTRRAHPSVNIFFSSLMLTSFVKWTMCRSKFEKARDFVKTNPRPLTLITTDKTDEFYERQKEFGVLRKLSDEEVDKMYGDFPKPPPPNSPERLR